MVSTSTARLATCAVVVSLVGAAAATLPAGARADEGTDPASGPATVVPSLDSAVVPAAEAGSAIEGALPGVPDTVEAPISEREAEPAGEGPVTGPEAGAAGAATAAPASEPEIPDTTANPVDISADTAPQAAPAPATREVTAQTPTSNVNVSVRIGSPGDNGPVTQVSIDAALPPAATPADDPVNAVPATAGGRLVETDGPPAASPDPRSPVTPSPGVEGDSRTWSWQWDCGSAPDMDVISGAASDGTSIPENWTWIWNCDPNPAQYQNESSRQYQASNVNISIRISSAGDNGPVRQTNIAAGVGVEHASVRTAIGAVSASAGTALAALAAPASPAVTARAGPSSVPPPVDPPVTAMFTETTEADVVLDALVNVRPVPEAAFGAIERPEPLSIPLDPTATGPAASWWSRRPERGARTPIARPLRPGPLALASGRTPVAIAEVAARLDRRGSAMPSVRRAKDGAERPGSRWRAPRPQPLPETAPPGASAAPATSGGSSGGGIPIFLALPFLAAILDLAGRVVLAGVALPSGYRSRVPERPG